MKKYLKKLQMVELSILVDIDKICRKYKIEYFIGAGTLLGAIRHKGFIPWDDDIDLFMTRYNYNKFLDICSKKLDSSKYFIDSYKTNKKCCISYAKIKRKGTLFVEQKNYDFYDENSGIWVDIFPLDGVKKPFNFVHKFQYVIYQYITTLITIKNNSNYYKNSKIKKVIYRFILKFVPIKFMIFLLDYVIGYYNNKNVSFLCSFSTVYGIKKETFVKNKISSIIDLEFEEKKFKGLKNYDYYLKKMYGNYMKLPPKNKRINHNPYILKFENEKEIYFDLEDKYK